MNEDIHKGKRRWTGGKELPWLISCLCQLYTFFAIFIGCDTFSKWGTQVSFILLPDVCHCTMNYFCPQSPQFHNCKSEKWKDFCTRLLVLREFEQHRNSAAILSLLFGFCHIVHIIYYSFFNMLGQRQGLLWTPCSRSTKQLCHSRVSQLPRSYCGFQSPRQSSWWSNGIRWAFQRICCACQGKVGREKLGRPF